MDQRRHRQPYPPDLQRLLNPGPSPGIGHNRLPAEQLDRIEAGIREVLRGQHEAHTERRQHAAAITAELDDLTGIATRTKERVDNLEEDHRAIRADHNKLRIEIEQRVNRGMWWVLGALLMGMIGLFFAVLKNGLS